MRIECPFPPICHLHVLFGKVPTRIFCSLFYWVVCCWALRILGMFWIQGGSQIRGLEICVADLILLVISEQTFYLDKVKFINFFLSWITLLTLNLRNLCLTQGHKVFLFSSKSLYFFIPAPLLMRSLSTLWIPSIINGHRKVKTDF